MRCVRHRTNGWSAPEYVTGVTHDQSEWQQLLDEYALARAAYQLAREAADRRPRDLDTLRAAFLAEDQARERLIHMRRRMYQLRPLHSGPLSSDGTAAEQLNT